MPKALIFYHYFYPDDVVSAVHVSELAAGLAERGWEITAMPCNRGCRDESRRYKRFEAWKGIRIERIPRPKFPQASAAGRLLNAGWMILCWSLAALSRRHNPDAIIVGTDPILSVLTAVFWKVLRPRTKVVHWCFDMYPEAAVADGLLKAGGGLHRLISKLLQPAYRACDLIVDIGSCMREHLERYRSSARTATLTPWALAEPSAPLEPDREERARLYDDAAMGLMYSGNFGRAHSHDEILQLGRRLRDHNIKVVFSVRGNREQMLRDAVREDDTNISFCGFASAEDIEKRLSAADIHIVSLRTEWTGMVVPSKFFGAIAAGRPVLFAGSPDSAVAKWIQEYQLGWVLTPSNIYEVADELIAFMSSPQASLKMRRHCFDTYQKYFCRERVLDRFDFELRALLSREAALVQQPASADDAVLSVSASASSGSSN